MFEKHIQKTKDRILNLINSESKFLYLQDILANDSIDSAYKNYFSAEVAWWIYKEQLVRKKNNNFDLKREDIKSFYKEIDNLYIKSARFDKNNIAKVVDNAVKTNLNFIVRPQTTLKWFTFRGELTKSFYEIILRLDYLYYYSYLKNELISCFSNDIEKLEHNIIVSAVEFTDAIEKIDADKISSFDTDGFIELVKPVFEFFNPYTEINDDVEIPIEAAILFFDDKSMKLLKEKAENMLFESDKKTISIEGIRQLIETDVSVSVDDLDLGLNIEAEELDGDMLIPAFEIPENLSEKDKNTETLSEETSNSSDEEIVDEVLSDIDQNSKPIEQTEMTLPEEDVSEFEINTQKEDIEDSLVEEEFDLKEQDEGDTTSEDEDTTDKKGNEQIDPQDVGDYTDEPEKPDAKDDKEIQEDITTAENYEESVESIPMDYINKTFESAMTMLETGDMPDFEIIEHIEGNANQELVEDIIGKSLAFLEEELKGFGEKTKEVVDNSGTE